MESSFLPSSCDLLNSPPMWNWGSLPAGQPWGRSRIASSTPNGAYITAEAGRFC